MNKISKIKFGSKTASEVNVPAEISFKDKPNMELLAQAWRVYFEREHVGGSVTLTRSEINRTTKKWFKQKGTGNARHGARSAPIFVGGGKAHGPKGIKRELKMSKKMAQKALESALTLRISEKGVVMVTDISKVKKTKEANILLKNISEKGSFLVVLESKNVAVRRFFRNIENVLVTEYKNLNVKDVLRSGTIVIDADVFSQKEVKKESAK